MLYVLALLIGVVAGLRAMTAPAAVAWGAYLGWLPLAGTWAGFMGHWIAVAIFTVLALAELVTDQLPSTPSRKVPQQFGARVVSGAFTGAVIGTVGGALIPGLIAGVIGAKAGLSVTVPATLIDVTAISTSSFVSPGISVMALGVGITVNARCSLTSITTCAKAGTPGVAESTTTRMRPSGVAGETEICNVVTAAPVEGTVIAALLKDVLIPSEAQVRIGGPCGAKHRVDASSKGPA